MLWKAGANGRLTLATNQVDVFPEPAPVWQGRGPGDPGEEECGAQETHEAVNI